MGGVPEHFNLPWRIAIEERAFLEHGLDVEFTDYPAGTGAMTAELAKRGARVVAVDISPALVEIAARGAFSRVDLAALGRWYAAPILESFPGGGHDVLVITLRGPADPADQLAVNGRVRFLDAFAVVAGMDGAGADRL